MSTSRQFARACAFTNNSNTIGNLFTTDGNIGIGTTAPGESLDIRGNLRIGYNTQSNFLAFYGTSGDGPSWSHTFIGERIYGGTEQSELLLYKGNDTGSSSAGPDRIRLLAAEHRFDTYTSAVSNATFDGVGTNVNGNSRIYGTNLIVSNTTANQVSVGITSNSSGLFLISGNTDTKSYIQYTGDLNFSKSGGTSPVIYIQATSGNVGISTATPNYTLDVNGTIARSGVKLPRFDNGTFSGATTAVIPIYFSDTQYNIAEIRFRIAVSTICNVTLSGNSNNAGNGTAFSNGEVGETVIKQNAQASPLYFNSSFIATSMESASGTDGNGIIRIIRTPSTTSNFRNHYSSEVVYCLNGVGTTRLVGMGWVGTTSTLSIGSIILTVSTGTISGVYNTTHYY